MNVISPNCATCNHPEWKHFGETGSCQHLDGRQQCTCPEYRGLEAKPKTLGGNQPALPASLFLPGGGS